MPHFRDPLDLRYEDGRNWKLLAPFEYEAAGITIRVPIGFTTDFASVPRLFWRLLPPTGRYGKAAVVHDYIYRTGLLPRDCCDHVFLDAMRDLRVGWLTRTVMFLAVRIFGGPCYRRHRERRHSVIS